MRVSLSSRGRAGDPRVRAHLHHRAPTSTSRPWSTATCASWSSGCATLGFGGQLFVMLSSGGIWHRRDGARFPVRLLESGPAAGALATALLRRAWPACRDLLSFDMGGTTAKLCVIENGQPLTVERLRGRPRVPLQEGQRPAGQGAGDRDDRDRRRRRQRSRGSTRSGCSRSARTAPARSPARPATAAAAPSRPSPTPTWCSATSIPASSSAGG